LVTRLFLLKACRNHQKSKERNKRQKTSHSYDNLQKLAPVGLQQSPHVPEKRNTATKECGREAASEARTPPSVWNWCGIREEDARTKDPNIVDNGIGAAISRNNYQTMARSKCLLLYRATFYYGRGGYGLEQIRNKAVSAMDMRLLFFALYTENKQSGERVDMGRGFKILADLTATILRQIHEVLFTEPIFDPLWCNKIPGETPLLSYDIASPENIEALFPASNDCALCLQSHKMHECQLRKASIMPICPKPTGPIRRDSHRDLIYMLLAGKYGSLKTLTEPTIRAWVQLFRPTTTEQFSGHLHMYCDLSGQGPKGDLWALKKGRERSPNTLTALRLSSDHEHSGELLQLARSSLSGSANGGTAASPHTLTTSTSGSIEEENETIEEECEMIEDECETNDEMGTITLEHVSDSDIMHFYLGKYYLLRHCDCGAIPQSEESQEILEWFVEHLANCSSVDVLWTFDKVFEAYGKEIIGAYSPAWSEILYFVEKYSKLGYTIRNICKALNATNFTQTKDTEEILVHLESGNGIPNNMLGVWTRDHQIGLCHIIRKHRFDLDSWCKGEEVWPDGDYELLEEILTKEDVEGVQERMDTMRELFIPAIPDANDSPTCLWLVPGDFELVNEGPTQRYHRSVYYLVVRRFLMQTQNVISRESQQGRTFMNRTLRQPPQLSSQTATAMSKALITNVESDTIELTVITLIRLARATIPR
jgi:TRF2-interacting telomeric protein/Rap1 - C terminal domain